MLRKESQMFCMISRSQTSAEKLDLLTQVYNEQVIPLVSQQEGFKGVYLMVQPTGSFMVLNMWDARTQAQSWLRHAKHQQIETQITPLLDAAIIREGFEVRGHSVAEESIDSAPESE
jgi:heme-degrading monooxygenase HmoA